MDAARLRTTLGWAPRRDFDAGLAATVEWYLTHRTWWERVLSEAYRTAAAMYLVER
jgi:dTDP-glucose 4,6-dehydratase